MEGNYGAGEMTQELRVPAAFAKDLSSFLIIGSLSPVSQPPGF